MSKSARIQEQNVELQQNEWLLKVQQLKSSKQIADELASGYSIETFFCFLFYCIGMVKCYKICNTSSRVLNMSQLPFIPTIPQSHA